MKNEKPTRSSLQNRSMHQLFRNVAEEMNDRGIDMGVVLESIRIEVNEDNIKEIWRAIQKVVVGKESTAELTTAEVDRVYEQFVLTLSKLGLEDLEWPSVEKLYYKNKS